MTLKLPVGVYTISAPKVSTRSGAYYATVAHERVRLRAARLTRVTLDYATFAPKSTRAVATSATVSLVGGPSGPRVLTLNGSAARGVKAGEILASGPSAAAPDGYLVKVVRVASTRGGRVVLDIENATLLEALPSGEIDVNETLVPPAGAASVGHGGSQMLRQASPGARSAHAFLPVAHAAGFSLPAANLSCTTSAGVHLTPTVSFSPQIAFHAKWGLLKLDSASFTATVNEGVSLSASADAGASCQTKSPGIGLLAHPIRLAEIDVQVGPVPVVIVPTLQVYLSGSAGVTASLTASLQQSSTVTIGAGYAKGQFTPISSFSPHFGQSFTPEGDANGELALRPTVDTLIYGIAGPSFDIGAAAKFDANTASSPWWTLQGCLQGGIGFVVDILKINWSKPNLISLCKTLLSANGGYTGGGGGSGVGGGEGGERSGGGGGDSTPPAHDRPQVNIPQVGQALWTMPMGDDGMIIPAQDGSLITTKCSYHSTTDADVPYTLQQVAPDGSLDWRRGSDNSDCGENIRDSAGNDYYVMSDNTGVHIRSVNSQGWVRWTTTPLPNNMAGWGYGPPTLGTNGDAYFAVYNGYGVGYLIGVDETTGVVTVDQVLGFPLAIYAYSAGLVVAKRVRDGGIS
jgi:hypothetical protein